MTTLQQAMGIVRENGSKQTVTYICWQENVPYWEAHCLQAKLNYKKKQRAFFLTLHMWVQKLKQAHEEINPSNL